MAKTRQTAKLSSGGRFIRRSLNTRAVRKATPAMKRSAQSAQAEVDTRMEMLGGRTDVESLRYVSSIERFRVLFRDALEWILTDEEAGMLFGRHIPLFVKSDLWDTMSVRVACRLGLHKSTQDGRSHEVVSKSDWNISRIWLSDESYEEERRSYCATQTGVAGLWKIDLYTFRPTGSNSDESCVESGKEARDQQGRFWFGKEGKVTKIFEIDAFCSEFPGRRLVLNSVMGRDKSADGRRYMDLGSVIAHPGNGTQCVCTSFLNALKLFCVQGTDQEFIGKQRADIESRLIDGKRARRYRSVRCLGKALDEFLPRLELGHIRDGTGDKIQPRVNFLVRREIEGVLMITVRAVCGMCRAVVVDTRCKPGMVLDGVEKHTMWLCPESFALCVGCQKKFDCLEDVRVLRWKPSRSGVKKVNKKKRKRREEWEAKNGGSSK